MKIVKNAVNAEAVSLSMLDEEGSHLVFEVARGRRDKAVRGLKIPVGEGVIGWVAKHERPLMLNDVRKDKRYSLFLERKLGLRPKSILAIPLMRRNRLIGVLEAVNRRGQKPFEEEDLNLAMSLGDHIAIAVSNTRLFARAERLGLEYSLLAQVSADVSKSFTLEEVLQRILKNLHKLIPFDAAAIFLLDREKRDLVSTLHQGYPRGADDKINLKSGEGLVGRAARERRGIIVSDVRENDLYVNVRGRTRSEMVIPMLSRGKVVGSFNLESDRVDAYRKEDLTLLKAFASQAAVSIERAHLYDEQNEKLEIQKELRLGRTVQDFFTPKRSRTVGQVRIAGVNFPSLEVSGDHFDYFPVRDNLMAFVIADVAGKGVPAALIVSSLRATLHTVGPYLTSARQIALRANQILLETVRPQDFVTAFIGVIDPRTREITYCNAGHNPPVLLSPDGRHRLLEAGGPILGVFDDPPMQEGRFVLGDEALVCYTDGATEIRNEEDEEFGEERLIESAINHFDLPPHQMCRALFSDLRDFDGESKQSDDVTYLVIRSK
jgi:sigma-B regulation protein RsbU (phosphoserine phosphatase)